MCSGIKEKEQPIPLSWIGSYEQENVPLETLKDKHKMHVNTLRKYCVLKLYINIIDQFQI
jgi:hypothetical protein